jgi:predicted permease
MSVRLALGAGRTRLMGQLLLEGTALAGLGAIAGVGVARGLLALVPVLVPRELLRPPDVSLDAHALAFAAAIAVVTGLVFGLVPTLQLRRVDLADALKTRTRSATTGRRGVRSALVTTEIAFTLLLLSCASLVGRGLVALSRVDPGFAVDDVRVVSLTLPPDRYATAVSRRAFASDVVTRLAAVPGVESAAVTNAVPLGGALSTIAVEVEDRPVAGGQDWTAAYRVVGAGYFKTLGIRLVEGRAFTPGDARIAVPLIRWFPQQPVPANFDVPQPIPVAIVNEAMAQRFWPEQDAIGRRFRLLFSPWITVVGVAANTRDASLGDAAGPELYLHDLQEPQADLDVLVRDARDGGPAIIDLEQAIRRLDRGVAIR